MALKGTTMIELTNVKTGEKEVYKDTNMVTNAMTDIFRKNLGGMLYCINGAPGDFYGTIVPFIKNGLGGILLFSDPLEEDVDKYFAPSTNPCVGYASNDVNSGTNVKRGSLNLTESVEIENGFKFVWDFTTSQANGTISALALTHKNAGRSYMGDTYDNPKVWYIKSSNADCEINARNAYIHAVEADIENNFFWSIGLNTKNEIVIQKVRNSFTSVGVLDTMVGTRADILEEHILTPSVFVMSNPSSNTGTYDFMDGKDGYWYGIWHSANSSGDATFWWIKIDKGDFTFEEGKWTLKGVYAQSAGEQEYYDTDPRRYVNSVIRNGYLYLMSYDRQSVYKINLENSVDVEQIKLGFTSNFSRSGGYDNRGGICVYKFNDWIVYSDFMIDAADEIHRTTNNMYFDQTQTELFQYGPYMMGFGQYYGRATRINLFLMLPYLATINNLETSVIKTADKTMKITYYITEEPMV